MALIEKSGDNLPWSICCIRKYNVFLDTFLLMLLLLWLFHLLLSSLPPSVFSCIWYEHLALILAVNKGTLGVRETSTFLRNMHARTRSRLSTNANIFRRSSCYYLQVNCREIIMQRIRVHFCSCSYRFVQYIPDIVPYLSQQDMRRVNTYNMTPNI